MSNLKVVIADDEERICQLIQALINWDSLEMEIAGMAHNGIEAFDVVQKVRPDILITDIRMPGLSGLELIEKVKAACPEVEIIIISGYAHFEYAQQAIRFGVGHYLLKPINKAELTETLEKLKSKIGQRQESERDKQVLIQKAQKNEDYMRSKLLTQLLNGEQVSLNEEILKNQYGITLKSGLIQSFCLKMDCEEEALGTSSVSVLMEKALEILDRNLREKGLDPIMECQGFYCIGLLNYESRQQEDVRRILKNALSQLELQKAIFKSVEFSLALGRAVRGAEDLEDAGPELSRLICQRLVKGSGRILEQQENYTSL